MPRRSVIALSIVLGALAGAVVGLKSPRVEENLRQWLIDLSARHAGVHLEIDALSLELLPPAVILEGVRATRGSEAPPWITLHRGRVVIRPWPSPSGVLVIDHLELDGLRIDHTLEAGGEPLSFERLRLPVDIHELQVWNGRLRLVDGERTLQLGAFDLTMTPHPDSGRNIRIDAAAGRVTSGPREVSFEVRMQSRLEGTLDHPTSLSIQDSRVFLRKIAVQVRGDVGLDPEADDPMRVALDLEGGAALSELDDVLPDLPAMRGQAQVRVEVRGRAVPPWALPVVRVSAEVRDAWVEDRALGTVTADAVLREGRLSVESFQLQHDAIGKVTGSGSVLVSSGEMQFNARLHRLALPVVIDRAGLDDAWVRARVSGDVHGAGPIDPLRVSSRVDLSVDGFEVLDGSYRDPSSVTMLALPTANVRSSAVLTAHGVEVSHAQIEMGGSRVGAEGYLSFDPAVGLELRAQATALVLDELGPVAGTPFGGAGTLSADLKGPYEAITITAQPEFQDFSVRGVVLGEAKGAVTFGQLKLQVERAVLTRGGGSARGRGHIDFNPADPQIGAVFEVRNQRLRGLLGDSGASGPWRSVDGLASGTVDVRGSLRAPVGEVRLAATELVAAGINLGSAQIALDLHGELEAVATLRIDAKPGGGRILTNVSFLPHGERFEITVEADVRAVPLEVLAAPTGLPAVGVVNGRASFKGPPTELSGDLRADIERFLIGGVALGATHVRAHAADGSAAVSGRTLGGRATFGGALGLGGTFPVTFDASLREVDVQPFTAQSGLTGTLTGRVHCGGELANPDSIAAVLTLDRIALRIHDQAIGLEQPTELSYRAGAITVRDLRLVSPSLMLNVRGLIGAPRGDAGAALDLSLAGHGDVAMLSPWVPAIERMRGPFEVRARISGTTHAPLVDGFGRISGVTLRPKGLGSELDHLHALLEFAGRDIDIQEGHARLGDGEVRFVGGVTLATDRTPTQLRLVTDLRRVTVHPSRQLSMSGSGNLTLIGPAHGLQLKGRIDLESLNYVKDLELSIESFFPRKDAPLRVPDMMPGEAIAVDVHVEAPGNLRLDAGAVQGEFRASLDFRGSTDSLGLNGVVQPIWAKARYRDLVFEYVRGDITFTEEFRVYAKYDLTAKGEGCGMKMMLNLAGDSRGDYVIDLEGEDEDGPVHEQDPWSCVTYGVRLSEFSGETAASQAAGTERATLEDTLGSGLDLLWGVSGLDAKVRQILPYVDEVRLTLGRSGRRGKNRRMAPRLVVGKDVGRKLQLKYNGALDETDDHMVSLEYELSKVATVQGSWVSISDVPVGDFGLDLRLSWEFD